jgi:HAD superfamily hydrolase (TIGR01549 family)
MFSKPYLLFDAGGTLVFPDLNFLIELGKAHGVYNLDCDKLLHVYYLLISEANPQIFQDWPKWLIYGLFRKVNVANDIALSISVEAIVHHKDKNLWNFTFPWVRKTLEHLASDGYGMSVISNSQGRVKQVFRELTLDHYFDHIFDSQEIGIEKPDPRIFEKALYTLSLRPEDALYIGDIFLVDVLGANQAGIGAIHIAPPDIYASDNGERLPDIKYLPKWLASYKRHPQTFKLFPFRKPSLQSDLNAKRSNLYQQNNRLEVNQLIPTLITASSLILGG